MPKVDINEVEKTISKQVKHTSDTGMIERKIGDKTYFSSALDKDVWFDNYGECLANAQKIANTDKLKALGLNDQGQSPEQVALLEKRGELLAKKAKALEVVAGIDAEIRNLKVEDFKAKAKKK